MAAFEFTPGGIVPLVERATEGFINPAEAAVALAAPAVVAPAAAPAAPRAPVGDGAAHAMALAKPEPLKRREYSKELRARLRVVDREIAALRSLENERAEIHRLLTALKAPPAKVTDINSARKSG